MAEAWEEAKPVIHVVDDDDALRKSILVLLSSEGFRVCLHESAEKFLEADIPILPGCVVVDLRMTGASGLQLQQHLNRLEFPLPVIFLTGHGRVQSAVQAMKFGAFEFIEKPADNKVLIETVRSASEASKSRIRRQRVILTLTDREREIAQHLTLGKFNKVIASELGISEKTIEFHRSHILQKLNITTIAELIKRLS